MALTLEIITLPLGGSDAIAAGEGLVEQGICQPLIQGGDSLVKKIAGYQHFHRAREAVRVGTIAADGSSRNVVRQHRAIHEPAANNRNEVVETEASTAMERLPDGDQDSVGNEPTASALSLTLAGEPTASALSLTLAGEPAASVGQRQSGWSCGGGLTREFVFGCFAGDRSVSNFQKNTNWRANLDSS